MDWKFKDRQKQDTVLDMLFRVSITEMVLIEQRFLFIFFYLKNF